MRVWRVYFGRRRAGGGTVSKTDFDRFLAACVRPRFRSFTVPAAQGYWEGLAELSTVIEVILSADEDEHVVKAVAADYKRLFDQQGVLVVGSPVECALI